MTSNSTSKALEGTADDPTQRAYDARRAELALDADIYIQSKEGGDGVEVVTTGRRTACGGLYVFAGAAVALLVLILIWNGLGGDSTAYEASAGDGGVTENVCESKDCRGQLCADACCSANCPAPAPCPYNFAKPACEHAEPQAPRDLREGALGLMKPKAPTLTAGQAAQLPLVNVHWHLGAEHRSEAYNDGRDASAYDAAHRRLTDNNDDYHMENSRERRLAGEVRPGWMCDTADLPPAALQPYTFQYCKNMEVGKTYEVHYVHSNAGYDAEALATNYDLELMSDGLGGAANGRGLLNPTIAVQGQVYLIVSEGGDSLPADILHDAPFIAAGPPYNDAVMYMGSTTGPSHNNDVCSPYTISWHVHKGCTKVTASEFDNMCKMMKDEYGMTADLYPHGSRKILDPKWVVPGPYVNQLY